jgi:multimeric flavodoxin WrbA
MTDALVLLCSPRPDGVSDTLARLFAQGATGAGVSVRITALRDYNISPCAGCMRCVNPPHNCVLTNSDMPQKNRDQAEKIFTLFAAAPLVFLAAPIYFYSLPSGFKAFIDRGQRFWAAKKYRLHHEARPAHPIKPVLAGLTAGRRHGRRLFTGALLTLKYFLTPLDAHLCEARFLRGMEHAADLLEQQGVCEKLRAWGRKWGERITTMHHYSL